MERRQFPFESAPGAGTRFRVLFPARGAEAVTTHVSPAELDWRGSGTVLIVDDDPGVRDMVASTFERAGLHVFTADGGATGVELYRHHASEIDLIVLDRTMPAEGGEACLDAIHRIRDDARVLLISGYSEGPAVRLIADPKHVSFLQKPFVPAELIEKARALLES